MEFPPPFLTDFETFWSPHPRRKCRLRDVRRRSTLGFAEHITPSNARLYHACGASISRATKLRYITTASPSISLRVSGQRSFYAQKEANETETWLSVLCKSGIIDELTFKSLRNKCGKIRRMLIASITTVKSKPNGQM